MSGRFQLPVEHEGQELEYAAELVIFGYAYKFIVTVGSYALIFETDDAGEFRVVCLEQKAMVDTGLLRSIIGSLSYLTRK